jgi:hypothetical protein
VRWATAGAEVALLGTDFDTPVLAAVRDGRAHPALGVTLHPALAFRSFDEWESVLAGAEVVVVALSRRDCEAQSPLGRGAPALM